MALALVRCSIEADRGGTPHARARVSLVSWEGRSHALLFMVPLGLPSARPMAQALRLPFEYYIYYSLSGDECENLSHVLWECSTYGSSRASFMKKLQELLENEYI